MPSRNQSGKPEHLFQNPNKKRKKSGKKYEKTFQWGALILQKSKKAGMEKWAQKTKVHFDARMKKLGITQEQFKNYLDKKGLSDLLS